MSARTASAERPGHDVAPFGVGLALFSLFMVGAGVAHFVNPEFYLRIMPPWLPWHAELVALSGALEIAAGLLVLPPATRRVGGWLAIAVFLGVFPANVWMAVDPTVWPEVPAWARWARLPFQAVLIAWAWRVTQPRGR